METGSRASGQVGKGVGVQVWGFAEKNVSDIPNSKCHVFCNFRSLNLFFCTGSCVIISHSCLFSRETMISIFYFFISFRFVLFQRLLTYYSLGLLEEY